MLARVLAFGDRAVGAASDPFGGEFGELAFGELAFDEVEARAVGGGEIDLESGMA